MASANRGRSSVTMVAAFGGTSLLNYAFGLVMARLLLPGDFGVLAFAQTLLLVIGLVLETGVPWSLARALAATSEHAVRARLVRGAALLNLGLALVVGLALWLLFSFGPLRNGLEEPGTAAAVALSLPFIALVGVLRGAAQGMQDFRTLASVQVIEAFGKAVVSTLLVLLGFGVPGAVSGFLAGAAVAAGVGLGLMALRHRMSLFGAVSWTKLRVVGSAFGVLLGLALMLNLDFLALKLLDGSLRVQAGYYQAGIMLSNVPYLLVSSVVIPLVFADLVRSSSPADAAAVVGRTLRLTLLLIIPVELVLIAAPELPLGILFPPAYLAGSEALRFRAIGVSLLILVAIIAASHQALGQVRLAVLALVAGLAVESILLLYALRWAAVGVAAAFAISAGLVALTLGLAYARHLGPADRSRLMAWLTGYGVALAVSGLAFWAASTLLHSTPVALCLGSLLYLGMIMVMRLAPAIGAWGAWRRPASVEGED